MNLEYTSPRRAARRLLKGLSKNSVLSHDAGHLMLSWVGNVSLPSMRRAFCHALLLVSTAEYCTLALSLNVRLADHYATILADANSSERDLLRLILPRQRLLLAPSIHFWIQIHFLSVCYCVFFPLSYLPNGLIWTPQPVGITFN